MRQWKTKLSFTNFSLAILSFFFIANAHAMSPGFYLGLMTGPAINSGRSQSAQVLNSVTTTSVTPKRTQFGVRAFLGYKYNYYLSLESGITFFSRIKYDTHGVQTFSDPYVQVEDLDLVAKGEIPFYAFAAYGKIGVAAVHELVSGVLNPSGSPTFTSNNRGSIKVRPTASLGLSYDATQNWQLDASLNRVVTGGPPSNIDFFALGFSYHFVDTYCGQFLCDP